MSLFKYRSIKKNLALSIIIMAFITSSILIILNYLYSTRKELIDLKQRTHDIVDQLGNAIVLHIWNYEDSEVENIINSYFQYEEIIYIRVISNEKKILKSRQKSSKEGFVKESRNLFYDNTEIGEIEIRCSKEPLKRGQMILLYWLFGFTIILLIIIAFSILAVMRYLLEKPVSSLCNAVKNIAAGAYDGRLESVPQKEINQIIKGVNTLAEKISTREKNLVEIQEFMKNIIEAMPSIIISVDRDYKIRQMNSKAGKLLNTDSGAEEGDNLFAVSEFFEKYRSKIEKSNIELTIEEIPRILFYDKSNEQTYYSMTIYPQGKRMPEGTVIRVDDITVAVENEDRLQIIQKMETIGSLGAGLAHDFNNTLMGITGSASLIDFKLSKNMLPDRESLSENIGIIKKSAKRAESIVKQLLTLSKEQDYEFCPVDLNSLIKYIYKFCATSFEENITIMPDYHHQKALVLGDPIQLEQVLHNLSLNAYHAMTIMRKPGEEKENVLYYHLDRIYADNQFREVHPEAEEGYYWVISVQDTGIGIDTSRISKIFEPFYTTKKKGEGTGLGLSMASNIIRMHRGFIDVYSEPGTGTTFKVFLPEYTGDESKATEAVDMGIKPGMGHILLCDDEEIIRKIGSRMIASLGFEVILCSTGKEAIESFRKSAEIIDIVILDVNMPDMPGERVFMELKKIKRGIKIIISSGISHDEMVKKSLSMGALAFLAKPYTIRKLANILKKTMKDLRQ